MKCSHGLAYEVKCWSCMSEALDREAKINAAKNSVPKGLVNAIGDTDGYKFQHNVRDIHKSIDQK